MKQVIEFIENINICCLVLNVLVLVSIYLYLRQKNFALIKKRCLLLVGIVVCCVSFSYFNQLFNQFFGLDYLSVKSYLIILAVTNIITLITINKKMKIGYEILNYTLFILMAVIFFAVSVIIIGDKIPKMYLMDIRNVVTLIDLSIVIFIIYLIGIISVYIGDYVFDNYSIKDLIKLLMSIIKIIVGNKRKNKKEEKEEVLILDETSNDIGTSNINVGIVLSPEELLEYEDKDNFCINGVECGIIFEDSIEENIIKNYYILLDDIDAPMVNGFTLNENKLLKSICMKLQVMDLENIDLDSSIVLNSINDEEYNFLKNICGE